MQSFLKSVAEDLIIQTGGNLKDLTIIFPNKRANLFFNQYLVQKSERPIWSPRYVTISEMFQTLSKQTLADPISLCCYLHKAFVDVTNSEVSLDKFYSWAEMMLNDFDDIDNNLVNVEKLFENVTELDQMTDFSHLSENQIEAIYKFFSNFNLKKKTKLKDKFLSIWTELQNVYTHFHDILTNEGYAYEGMMKRNVLELLRKEEIDFDKHPNRSYAVVGFNVLSESEKEFFKLLKERRTVYFYWDYDNAYTNLRQGNGAKHKLQHEAGMFIAENISVLGERVTENICHDYYKQTKNITYISSPTNNAQARYIHTWLNQNLTHKEHSYETAIVLCDEKLLQPIINSLPKKIHTNDKVNTDKELAINVTMGYPLSHTPICSYIKTLLQLQTKGRTNHHTWSLANAIQALKHPYTTELSDGESTRLIKHLTENNIYYPTDSYFSENEFIKTIFTYHKNTGDLLTYISEVTKEIGKKYKNNESKKFETQTGNDSPQRQLYAESIYIVHTIANRLKTIHESGIMPVKPETVSRLFNQIMASKNIPLRGEPLSGIQIMGILETRNLDFKNVLLLSANEGILPRPHRNASFIPYNLREAYKLSTIEKQTSLYAYYFYRLLQRAENITIAFNSTTDSNSSGEMSRFMSQLLIERPSLMPSSPQFKMLSLESKGNQSKFTGNNQVEKNKQAIEALLKRYDLKNEDEYKRKHKNSIMLLSPTAINTYLDCQLKFYLRYVAGIKHEEDDVSEEIDSAHFGTLFHRCMETIYSPYRGRTLNASDIRALADNTELITRHVDRAFSKILKPYEKNAEETLIRYTGEQLLNRHVIINYIKNQLLYEAENLCPLTIEALEDTYYTELEIKLNDESENNIRIRIGGIIDRIDHANIEGKRQLRIVDYKTSVNIEETNSVSDLFDSQKKKRSHHILQAMYYGLACSEKFAEPIGLSLSYVKKAKGELLPLINVKNVPINDFSNQYLETYKNQLTSVITEMFDTNKTFKANTNSHNCQYCEFKELCSQK